MQARSLTALLVVAAVGCYGVAYPQAAWSALDQSALEDAEPREAAAVARDIAALLEDMEPDAAAPAIVAVVHRYLASSIYAERVLQAALALVLEGDWTEEQFAALRSVYSQYAPDDLEAPGGGAPGAYPSGLRGAMVLAAPGPGGGASDRLATQDDPSPSTDESAAPPPPPLPAWGGGSDYRH